MKPLFPKVSEEYIDALLANAEILTYDLFDKQCVVVVKLENGFTLVGESGCVDPRNYDEKIGYDICMRKIKDQLWMLEGYLLQNEIYKEEQNG